MLNGTNDKKNEKDSSKSGFRVDTKVGLLILGLLGVGLFALSYFVFGDETKPIQHEVFLFLGETLISAALISIIMEIHSIQDNYQKVRDFLILEEPSFIERYNEQEVNRILEYAIKRKIQLKVDKELDVRIYDRFIDDQNFFLKTYIENTSLLLGNNGFYCRYHRRQINIEPISNCEYKINITVELELQNFTKVKLQTKQKYKFYYISEKQIDSFKINYFQDNNGNISNSLNVNKSNKCNPSTSVHPFNYSVEFDIPIEIEPGGRTHYILNYEYENYEQACYITYSLPYITKSFQETYSLVGKNAQSYQIHASAYTPYKQQIDSRNLVQRLNEMTLSINSNNWIAPGSGFVAIIRKII